MKPMDVRCMWGAERAARNLAAIHERQARAELTRSLVILAAVFVASALVTYVVGR